MYKIQELTVHLLPTYIKACAGHCSIGLASVCKRDDSDESVVWVNTRVEPDTRLKRVSGTDKALLPSTSIIRVIRVNICARIE